MIKQFGLLPLSTVWEMFDSPNMLTPIIPVPVELLIFTSDMATLIVFRKKKVILNFFIGKFLIGKSE